MSSAGSSKRVGYGQAWWWAMRPKTLSAGIAPVLIGTALALNDGGFHAGAALGALALALFIQIGTNFCNDYYDFKRGADTVDRLGPLRMTQAGLITPRAMRRATVFVFSLAAMAGAALIMRGGWPMLWIAVFSILFGIAYTAGPWALAYMGLGDIFVLAFFGPIAVGGTYYVQTLEWPVYVTVAGLAPGLLSCGILMVNNLRDVEQDRQAGRRTLPIRFGTVFGRRSYLVCVGLAIAVIPLICVWIFDFTPWLFLSWLAVISAWKPMAAIGSKKEGAALNPVLGQTARTLFIYALGFTAGLLIAIL